jgi:SAM-dependent methyltransferase
MSWFNDWFGTEYYKILYNYRDDKEAQLFMSNLVVNNLQIPVSSKLLDLGCGKGRHSKYLASLGYDVYGCDVVPENISFAQKESVSNLNFFVQDMRKDFQVSDFDLILNLFTSFGYFDNEEDNFKTIHNIHNALNNNGLFIIDFFNAEKVKKSIIKSHTIERNNLQFNITKKIENNIIVKDIEVIDGINTYHYQERVMLLTKMHFQNYLDASNLRLVHIFGDYLLNPFNENESDRLIIVAQKNP